MTKLHISTDLSLPIETVTQKIAFLGRTGGGKTYAATKLAELMLEAKAQIVALDPVGKWYGLRIDADRQGKGFPIPVFGGLYGDVPLEPTAGALVADLIVDREISAILDVSQFISSEQARFATDFARQLFERRKRNPLAMHLFIEECQEFVPQNLPPSEKGSGNAKMMLHHFERLIKLGRNYGVGASLISQRPQEVNKKVLNMTEIMFAFQMNGPQERKAIESWVSDKGEDVSVVQTLPKLEQGDAHVWSPVFLNVSRVYHIAKKKTADVSATPKVGERAIVPKELSPVDVKQIEEAMASTIEKAKQDDPKELRRQVAELERQLKSKSPIVDQQSIDRAVTVAVKTVEREYQAIVKEQERSVSDLSGRLKRIEELAHLNGYAPKPVQLPKVSQPMRVEHMTERPRRVQQETNTEIGTGGLRRILISLAQRPQGMSARQLGVRAQLSSKSGTFDTYLSRARKAGWIEGGRSHLRITNAGLDALGTFEPLPEGKALLDYWLNELGDSGASRMLRSLSECYPQTLTRAELAERAGMALSGSFDTYMSKLRSLELIEGRGELKAADEFF